MITGSILSGIFIAFGACGFLCAEGKFIGALLFSFGLLFVVANKTALFTGMAHKLNFRNIPENIIVWTGNVLGAAFVGCLAGFVIANASIQSIIMYKFSLSMLQVIISGFFCGMLITLAVTTYKRYDNILCILFPIVVFVVCGFEHCIANVFYTVFARAEFLGSARLVFLSTIGNALGSKFIAFMFDMKLLEKK